MTPARGALCCLALGVLAACPAGPLEGGRYRCVVDGGADQCPDDWRCGFEGYCHRLGDTSQQWRCESELHCENGWSCGLADSRDAGACHDPAVAVPHACFADRHCTAGWHCGLEGRCYDRTLAVDHPCRFDAGDCADNWRCGLGGRCQDQDAGAAYLCLTDAGLDDGWCEQGWRCAPEGRCLDPREDALLLGTLKVPGAAEKIHPLAGGIERFTLSPAYASGPGAGRQTLAFVQDGQLRARAVDHRGIFPNLSYALGPWDGGRALAALGNRGETRSGAGQPFVVDENNRLYVVVEDGGVDLISLLLDGGAARDPVDTYAPATRLTHGSAADGLSSRVLTFTDVPHFFHRLAGDRYDVFDNVFREDGWTLSFDERLPNNRLIDAVSVRPSQFMECVFAVDRRGLWVSQQTFGTTGGPGSYGFEALEVPGLTNDACRPAVATQRITRLAPLGREWLAFSSTELDGGGQNVGILDLRPMWSRNDPEVYCTTTGGDDCEVYDRIPIEWQMKPCAVCTGGRLLDFAIVPGALGQPSLEVRCGGNDGGPGAFFILRRRNASAECTSVVAEGESGIFSNTSLLGPEHQVPGQVAWASAQGHLWVGSSSESVASELLDRPPTSVARRGPALAQVMAFTREVTTSFVPSVGLSSSLQLGAVSAVSRAPEWIVTDSRRVLDLTGLAADSEPRLLGVVGNLVNSFTPPYRAASAQSALARVLVVTAGSSVFSAELDATLAGQQLYATLGLKVVSPSQIDSLAFAPQAPAGVYLRGYVVTPNGVLRLTAQTSTRWGFEPVELPAALVPQEVWFEEDRGRVGFADGTVYSLPSRVPIAPPLGEGVIDYAQACGQQLALTSTGLFRLEPQPGSSVGRWEALILPPGFVTSGGFTRGRIHAAGSTLYVFKSDGAAARLSFEGCPSP